MQFQGIVLRIIVQILMSGAPTGELPGGVWRRPQGAVKRCRRGSLNTSSSFENPQSDSLKFHAFSRFLPLFGVQKSCMGSLFFHPTIRHCLALKTYIKFWCGAPPGCEFFVSKFRKISKKFSNFFEKKNFFRRTPRRVASMPRAQNLRINILIAFRIELLVPLDVCRRFEFFLCHTPFVGYITIYKRGVCSGQKLKRPGGDSVPGLHFLAL